MTIKFYFDIDRTKGHIKRKHALTLHSRLHEKPESEKGTKAVK